MNQLISQPFEPQINSWFYSVAERVCSSQAYDQALQSFLNELKGLKNSLLVKYRLASSKAECLHRDLTAGAKELLEQVSVAEGPTEFAWLNRPIHKLRAYLAGADRDLHLVDSLKTAHRELSSLTPSPKLQISVRNLMLWSEGHKTLSGLQVRGELEMIVSEASLLQIPNEEELNLHQLLSFAADSQGQDQEYYFQAFLASLEKWENDFVTLEEQVVTLLGEDCELLDASARAYDVLQVALEEEHSLEQLSTRLDRLQRAWEQACAEFIPLLSIAEQEQQSTQYENLERLLQLVAGFQNGSVCLQELTTELEAHQAQWNDIAGQLKSAWGNDRETLRTLSTVELALETLTSVSSPGDARLAPIASLYCQSIKSLINKA